VLEIKASGSRWLQRKACKPPPQKQQPKPRKTSHK